MVRMRPARPITHQRAMVTLAALTLVLSGCTRGAGDPSLLPGPSDTEPIGSTQPAPVQVSSSAFTRPSATPSTSPTGFSETALVPCNGRPSGDQVIAVVRRARSLPTGFSPTVKKGPLCSGTWQYTVLNVAGSEPLQVITRGLPSSLTLVTAGTDVCTVEVQVSAPPPLRTVASC